MQRIARELNLAETAFVLPATRKDCAARVRIFTPAKELVFAGHPTVGTAFVLRQKGIVPSDSTDFMLEEEVGPVPIRIEGRQRPLIKNRATIKRAFDIPQKGLTRPAA
jgi:trans-2,3-dihydro-3-hydroxyanthranilate isomerase